MALQIQNLRAAKANLENCDVNTFLDVNRSFLWFVKQLKVFQFRHINNLSVEFNHPVTAIAGSNRSGKTSMLLLLACSHEKFMRLDASSSSVGTREHSWNDVLSFTTHETVAIDYLYEMKWRRAAQTFEGFGKRLQTSRAWSGLGKKSSDLSRINAKVRGREVRLIDLERLLPGRAFSDSLYRKANAATATLLNPDIAQAFAYIFETPITSIHETGGHVNRRCFLISRGGASYSTYNAATGEEALIYLLKDLIDSPTNSLVLIDEIEAGFHPSVQRKIVDIVHLIAWQDKKQVIFTTHSPTILSSVGSRSRRFLEFFNGQAKCIAGISLQAASSKMDSVAHPLVQLYCEDDLAAFLIGQQLIQLALHSLYFDRLVNVVTSGPIDQVKNDYLRHKRNFPHFRNKLGYCAVFDGDYRNDAQYSSYHENLAEFSGFIFPYEAPEKFLVKAYLSVNPNEILEAALQHTDHHTLFGQMVDLGLAADQSDARNRCFDAFKTTPEYQKHSTDLQSSIRRAVDHFTTLPD